MSSPEYRTKFFQAHSWKFSMIISEFHKKNNWNAQKYAFYLFGLSLEREIVKKLPFRQKNIHNNAQK